MTKKTPKKIDRNDFAKHFFAQAIQTFQIDLDKATGKGIPFQLGALGTLMIHHAGTANKAYIEGLKELLERPDATKVDDEEQTKRLADLYAKTIVIALITPDGEAVAYDRDAQKACAEMLATEGMDEVFKKLREDASNAALFRREQTEKHSKN